MASLTSETPKEEKDYNSVISSLPQERGWKIFPLRKHHNFWLPEPTLPFLMAIQDSLEARPSDIILATTPKSGTNWIRALAFSVANRKAFSLDTHPLLTSSPHHCVPLLPFAYLDADLRRKLDSAHSPRIIALHMAYSSLPESVERSGCRIVYLCRDPKDVLVSMWHYLKALTPEGVEAPTFHQAYELFCSGASLYGPIWDHNLEYWNASLKRPERMLFLKYEEMMEAPEMNLRRLAEFMGYPFSDEEVDKGMVGEIVRLCSFEKLASLEVNNSKADLQEHPMMPVKLKAASFFRKGKVGDWRNHMSMEMAQKLDSIVEEKLRGSGLSFQCD